MPQIYILYHANCHDGFSAAYAAWKKFGDNAKYIPTNDRVNYPDFIPDGSEAYLLDFSFKRPVVEELQKRMSRLIILDHHITSQDDLAGFPDAVFDMNRSGCGIAWEYFHNTPVPLFLQYIQDHDIFTHLLPFVHEVTMYNFSLPFDFSLWDENRLLFDDIEKNGGMKDDSLPVLTGKTLGKYREIIVEKMIDRLLQWKMIAGYKVPVVNTPREFGGEICRELLRRFVDAPFAGYFSETKKGVEWGLRSRDFDVESIAKKLGGGGHKHAAGFMRMSKTEDIIDLPTEE